MSRVVGKKNCFVPVLLLPAWPIFIDSSGSYLYFQEKNKFLSLRLICDGMIK